MRISFNIKSFLGGLSLVLDVGSAFKAPHEGRATDEANLDVIALSQDWNAVGDDIRRSIAIIESERRVA